MWGCSAIKIRKVLMRMLLVRARVLITEWGVAYLKYMYAFKQVIVLINYNLNILFDY